MSRSLSIRIVTGIAVLALSALGAACPQSKAPRLEPKRLYSVGDSITTAFDAWFIASNPYLSWVNGTHGLLAQILGVPDINSHNQRIDAIYGTADRSNVMAADNGARWDDALGQSLNVVAETPSYVTVMLGGNDVCRDEIADLPTDAEIQGHVQDTLHYLHTNLPAGATVVVVGIPDVKRLHDVGLEQGGLLGLDCSTIWLTTALGFPCGSMLSPQNTEADRLFVQSRNFDYNDIIESETLVMDALSKRVYFEFHDAEPVIFEGQHISSIDCFHPSWEGQLLISEESWNDGPFAP